jgi:hypothetical protein
MVVRFLGRRDRVVEGTVLGARSSASRNARAAPRSPLLERATASSNARRSGTIGFRRVGERVRPRRSRRKQREMS